MSPATTTTTTASMPKKKFHMVPVPGEFTRGRWKCTDTRGGSTLGVFGNYPADDEFGVHVTVKKDVVSVRRRFPPKVVAQPTPAPASTPIPKTPEQAKVEAKPVFVLPPDSHITVVSKINKTSVDSYSDLSGYSIEGHIEEVDVFVPANVPVLTPQMLQIPAETSNSSASNPPSHVSNEEGKTTSTVVAIDNKIVQAMDLVKNHLTFAVREEVETLRTTIQELETKLALVREENRVLREHVSPDVLALISTNIHG